MTSYSPSNLHALLENGKKSCFKCGTSTTECGCPDDLSQLDELILIEIKDVRQDYIRMRGWLSEFTDPGIYRIITTIRRKPYYMSVSRIFECVE